jgi:eukaryotic-like serine/threonine-protein kinase
MNARPQPHAPPAEIGSVVDDKYRIESLLGAGGMGFVFAAQHIQLGHRVALKVLHSSSLSNHEVTERFLREGRALARLQGEHIARVSDVGTLPTGEPYMVMEFLEGNDLSRELTTRGPLPIVEAVGYIAQACEALAEAHVRGIVHRDLKPANLFLAQKVDGDLSLKVLDFGISKITDGPQEGVSIEADNITITSTIVGTPKYMSPEQIQNSRSVDSRTDIWGLGTILYELVTQKRPFAAESLALVCVKILHDEIPPPSSVRADVPPGIDAIVARCLKKDPNERYANVAELALDLVPFGDASGAASATRIQRILTTGNRASGPRVGSVADSSGSVPGLIGMTRTPSAARVDKQEAATITASTMLDPPKKVKLSRVLVIGGVALVLGVAAFVGLRSKSPAVPTETVATEAHSSVTSVTTTAPGIAPNTPPTTESAAPPPSVPSATASVKARPTGRPPVVHTARPPSTAPTATQSAAPKATEDVLEDRR